MGGGQGFAIADFRQEEQGPIVLIIVPFYFAQGLEWKNGIERLVLVLGICSVL